MTILRFGIVGCGHIAKKHALALNKIEGAELIAASDVNINNLNIFSEQFGLYAYANYDNLLLDQRIDAVIICSPSGLHADLARRAADAGKHILVEKPFVLNLHDGIILTRYCRKQGVKLGVVHPNRMKPIVRALYRAIKDEYFGKITHANATLRWNRRPEYFLSAPWRGTRAFDGGILFNQAIHNIDLLNWLVGPVDEVFAYSTNRVRNIEIEDVCVSNLKLNNGALGIIEAAVTLYPENLEETLSIFGSEGTAILGGKTLSRIIEWKFSCLTHEDAIAQAERINNMPAIDGHTEIIVDFIASILNNREPIVSAEDSLGTIRLITAIYESIKNNMPVRITDKEKVV